MKLTEPVGSSGSVNINQEDFDELTGQGARAQEQEDEEEAKDFLNVSEGGR